MRYKVTKKSKVETCLVRKLRPRGPMPDCKGVCTEYDKCLAYSISELEREGSDAREFSRHVVSRSVD